MPMDSQQLGPYRVLQLIKRGGGGSVYVGWDERLERRVALKFIALPRPGPERQALIAECRLQASIGHHLIVQLYDIIEQRNVLVLVMEYVAGNDLQEICRRCLLDSACVLELSMDLCVALDAAHVAGIVHRDIKPANILVDMAGHIKLADFGIAMRLGSIVSTAVGGRAGTRAYTPPEQRVGAASDERADLFALGVLLQQLLPNPPAELAAVIARLTEKDSERRPACAAIVRQQLLQIHRAGNWSGAPSLATLVASCARDTDALAQPAQLQASAQASQSENTSEIWSGAAIHTRPRATWVLGALLGSLILLLLFTSGVEVRELPAPVTVALAEPRLSLPQVSTVPGPAALKKMLMRVIDNHPQLVLAPTYSGSGGAQQAAVMLELDVSCNEYVCGTRLLRLQDGVVTADQRALLPGAAELHWQQRLEQGVSILFALDGR